MRKVWHTGMLIFWFFPVLVAAQEVSDSVFEAESGFRYLAQSNAKDQAGKVGLVSSDSEVSYNFKAAGKLPVTLSLQHHYIGIDNTSVVKLPAHLVGLGLDIEATLPFFNRENTYFRFGLTPSYFGDNWDCPSSAFRIPMRFFLIHRSSEKLIFIGGIGINPGFETAAYPILGFIYTPHPKLTFYIVPDKPYITYAVSEKLDLFINGGTALGSEYEVKKETYSNTVLRYKETRLGCGLAYALNKNLSLSVSGGGVFNRTFQYKDSLGKVNLQNGFYSEFRVEMSL